MLSGPELARLLVEFEDTYLPDSDPENLWNYQNHEQGFATQQTFHKQVLNLSSAIRSVGNPFLDDFPELVRLDNRDFVHESVVVTIRSLHQTGKNQYDNCVKDVFSDLSKPIQQPIKKNSLPLFRNPKVKVKSKQGQRIKVLQNNSVLFGHLYISMQDREGDLKEFFAHEAQPFPPSISDHGKLYLPNEQHEQPQRYMFLNL